MGAPVMGAGRAGTSCSLNGLRREERPSCTASSRWLAARMLTAKPRASRIIGRLFESFSRATTTIGGVKAACITQLAVIPWSSPSLITVTAYIPYGKWRKTVFFALSFNVAFVAGCQGQASGGDAVARATVGPA